MYLNMQTHFKSLKKKLSITMSAFNHTGLFLIKDSFN